MEAQQLREYILKELPALMQNDSSFREAVLNISKSQFVDKAAWTKLTILLDKEEQRLDLKIMEDRQKELENQRRWDEN